MENANITKARESLAKANDTSLSMELRKAAFADADGFRKAAHVGWTKIGDVPNLTDAIESSVSVAVPVKAGRKAKAEPAPKAPLVPGNLVLRNPIQVALFTKVILPEITGENGRWGKTRPTGHAEPWAIAHVRHSTGEADAVGIDFAAPKVNYNVNDSNWVNRKEVLDNMIAVATAANDGKEVTKKHLVQELVDMKAIFGTIVAAAAEKAAA